jgi:molybdopterin synthase catalytic subunit
MRVEVLCFALARQLAGSPRIVVDLPDPATIADLRAALALACPALGPLLPHTRLAVNNAYATDDTAELPPDAEVALIPPVSGGSPTAINANVAVQEQHPLAVKPSPSIP